MRKPKIDAGYFTICVYVFIVAAITTLAIIFSFNFSEITSVLGAFFAAIKSLLYGLCFSFFINYALKFAEKRMFFKVKNPISRRLFSLLVAYLFFAGLLTAFLLLIIPEIIDSYESLVAQITNLSRSLIDRLNGPPLESIEEMMAQDGISSMISGFIGNIVGVLGNVLLEIGNIVIGLVLSFYILFKKESVSKITSNIFRLILPDVAFGKLSRFVITLKDVFGKYFLGTLVASFFVGVETLIACFIAGIDYAVLVAVIVAFTNVIPYFGPFIGAIPSCIIIFADQGFVKALLFVVIILAIQQIDGNFITPKIIGSSVGLGSVWIIIAVTVFNSIFGIVGMLIGVPLFTVIYNTVKELINRRLKKKGLTTDRRVYERLFSSSTSAYAELTEPEDQRNETEGGNADEAVQAE